MRMYAKVRLKFLETKPDVETGTGGFMMLFAMLLTGPALIKAGFKYMFSGKGVEFVSEEEDSKNR